MDFPRSAVAAIVFAAGLFAATPAPAAEVSMASGNVHFSTPDGWNEIMETSGDPEVRAFQVPDPSATGQTALARVTVTVKQVTSINDFRAFESEASSKANLLTGYKAGATADPNNLSYTAKESGVAFSYRELYWFKGSYAVQLRCARPQQSQAGAAWTAAFDRGCAAIAAQLK
ncbi:MAG: hypothetical protein KGI63_04775 [Xanthomonadaceae bacterium]|nr:hypothetical protein [Xanthomonadaceae bacterium]